MWDVVWDQFSRSVRNISEGNQAGASVDVDSASRSTHATWLRGASNIKALRGAWQILCKSAGQAPANHVQARSWRVLTDLIELLAREGRLPAAVSYPLSHLYGHFGLLRLSRLGHDVPWTKA
jgi:hypothetical protein